jgi:oligopeptidase B
MRPELFRTTIALVPFVDCLTTMLDPTIPLTVTEYIEWGNPAESKDVYDTIHSYAPVDNVRSGVVYPNIFIETGISDARVAYWEPSKWCAKLRTVWQESAAAGRALVYRINMEAGHGGYAGARYKQLEEIAFEYAFLLKTMGINK